MKTNYTFLQSSRFALTGIKLAFEYNRNLRIHLTIAAVVIIASVLLRLTIYEAALIGVLIVLVFCAEMMNTVAEEIVDLVTKEHREEARIAKDVAAAMVLTASAGAAIMGLFIFIPHLLKLFSQT